MEVIVQTELVHPRVDPCARAAGGDGDAQAEGVSFLKPVSDARKKVQVLAQFPLAGLADDFDGVPIESTAGAFFEIPTRIIAGVEIGADNLGVKLHGQLVAVLGKDFSPSVVTGAFGINDEAVEVEDDGAKGSRHGCEGNELGDQCSSRPSVSCHGVFSYSPS